MNIIIDTIFIEKIDVDTINKDVIISIYIIIVMGIVFICDEDILEDINFLYEKTIPKPKTDRLKILLPKIFPKTSSALSTMTIEEKLVISSGKDVTAARIIPPIKAPERSVFLSIRSTYFAHFKENHTTKKDIIK